MADITQTPANVKAVSKPEYHDGTAGASITAGMPVYEDTTDSNHLKPADASAEATAKVKGIALHAAEDGQPLRTCTGGKINPGAALTPGQFYAVSETAGGIAPVEDIVTSLNNPFPTLLGFGDANGNLDVNIIPTGNAL